jgi:hypothetical protein
MSPVSSPAWLDELDLHVGPPDAVMGTHALDDARWLLVEDDWVDQREQSRALLRERRSDVLAGSAPGAAELGARIDRWLHAHRPDLVDAAHEDEADPLAAASVRVAEDLCLLTPDDGRWVLAAGCVCFPSYWVLRDKVGRPLDAVHGPVPGYATSLAPRVDGFLGRLRPGQGVWRRNWSFHDVPDLYVPVHPPGPTGHERWLRTEYQTLLRLEESDAVVFTIRTQQVPIEVLADRPDVCARFLDVLRAWSPAQRAYKGGAVDEALLRWLEDHTRSA